MTLVGYADDYAWFAGLVRRLFLLRRRRRRFRPPTYVTRVERFAQLFGERHFPLYAPIIEFWTEVEDEPPWSWLRRGIPFDLMGFGYDGLHEMWNGYREGLSAMALLVKPPDVYYDGPDGLRVAWLESAAERIPQETLLRVPQGGIPLEDLTGALKGTRFEGAAQACSWVLAETGNFFLDHCYDDGSYDGFADPWEDDIIAGGHGGVAQGQRPHGLGVQAGRLAGGGPPRPLRQDAGLHAGAASRPRKGGKRTMSE